MENHIKEFKDHSGYGEYMNQQPPKPIVSWCLSDDEIHYVNTPLPVTMYYSEAKDVAKGGTRDIQTNFNYCILQENLETFIRNGYTHPYPGVILVNGEFVNGVSDQLFIEYVDDGFWIYSISSSILNPFEDHITICIYDKIDVSEIVEVKDGSKSSSDYSYIPPHKKHVRTDVRMCEYVQPQPE